MRALIVNPLMLAVSALLGVTVCRARGWNPHAHEMQLAGIICLAASELAIVPLLLHRNVLPMMPAQAGLLATVIHLMVATAAAGAAIILVHPSSAFVFWLLVFYWLSLIVVAASAIRMMRAMPASAMADAAKAAGPTAVPGAAPHGR